MTIRCLADSLSTSSEWVNDKLHFITIPTLVVWGAEDHIIPVADGEKMHQMVPQSEFDVIQHCGHLAPVQCAEAAGPKVQAFLSK